MGRVAGCGRMMGRAMTRATGHRAPSAAGSRRAPPADAGSRRAPPPAAAGAARYAATMSHRSGTTGIVLAGGAASRFGSDKLAAILNGRPILHHALAATAAVCDEIILVVGQGPAPSLEPPAVPLHVIRDTEPFAGPRAGLLAGAGAASHPLAVVVGADMPWLKPAFLDLLLERLDSHDHAAAAAILGGALQPLPCAVRIAAVREVGAKPHGSLLALLEQLGVAPLPERTWRAVDPAGESLQDVDRPEDLAGPVDLPARGRLGA